MPVLERIPGREQIELVLRKLEPDVTRIVLNAEPDWSGDPALYIRVLISDEAGKERLNEVTARARLVIAEELGLENLDRIPYFKFRGVSEQAKLQEKAWE